MMSFRSRARLKAFDASVIAKLGERGPTDSVSVKESNHAARKRREIPRLRQPPLRMTEERGEPLKLREQHLGHRAARRNHRHHRLALRDHHVNQHWSRRSERLLHLRAKFLRLLNSESLR